MLFRAAAVQLIWLCWPLTSLHIWKQQRSNVSIPVLQINGSYVFTEACQALVHNIWWNPIDNTCTNDERMKNISFRNPSCKYFLYEVV